MNQFQNLPLTALVASPTNPRKTFEPVKLKELATSIAASGVHQAILVRQLPAQRLLDTAHIKPRPEYEIVAGERRYRASVIAKADTIPAIIRELTDEQVLEIQIIENLQRDDLSALEAAEGYQTLMDHSHLTADQVAEKIGKSRTFVYNSLKLLKLSPTAKLAMREQGLTASVAELIARIPNDALQAKALAFAVAPDGDGDKPSYRTFSQWAQRNVMLNLNHAYFPIDLATLVPAAGACTTCSKRTGANPDLFTDVKSADMCTDPPCYHAKAAAQEAIDEEDDDPSGELFGDEGGEGGDKGSDIHNLASAAARQAKADPEAALKRDIEILIDKKAVEIDKRSRIAAYDTLTDHILTINDIQASTLLAPELLRLWLIDRIDRELDTDEMAMIFNMPPLEIPTGLDYNGRRLAIVAYEDDCKLRISRAKDADLYRYVASSFILPDRAHFAYNKEQIAPADLFDAFAKSQEIDLEPARQEAAAQVEDETRAQIQAINEQIKAAKPTKTAKAPKSTPAETTSTPTPAGAAIGSPAADAKNQKPAGASRKAKTTEQEAKAGIAAAMQSIEAEPTGASLEGSEEAAFTESNGVKVGQTVEILFGRHFGKIGKVTNIVSDNMFDVAMGTPPKAITTRLSGHQFQKVKS